MAMFENCDNGITTYRLAHYPSDGKAYSTAQLFVNVFFSVDRNFDPGNTSVSYTVKAVYEGCNVSTATLNATDFEGNSYTVCSTFYSYYKPSANVTTFVVEPQVTETETSTKTPEQLQQEAQDSGWLSIYSEFSWWYPWYRLHFVGIYGGESMIDVGVAVLPLVDCASLNTLLNVKIDTQITDLPGILLTGMIMGETAIWLAGNAGPLAFAIFVGGWILIKLLLFQYAWNSAEKLWESLIGNFISTIISAFNALAQFLPEALQALASGVASMKNWAFAFIYKCIMIPINIYLIIAAWDRLCALGAV
jgi:hypothetical protein